MPLVISDEILQQSQLNPNDFMTEIAIWLYSQQKLSLGKCANMANMPKVAFQNLLASRQIPVNYDYDEFLKDKENLTKYWQA